MKYRLLSVTLVLIGVQSHGANLILNGDFEAPVVGPPYYATTFSALDDRAAIPGWTLAPHPGGDNTWLYALYRDEAFVTIRAIAGQSLLFAGGGWIEQTIPTLPGSVYSLRYDTAATRYAASVLDVFVLGVGGTLLAHHQGAADNWGGMPVMTYSTLWQANGDCAKIVIGPALNAWHNWPIVDNVTVEWIHAPEPGTWAVLAGLGLVAFAAGRRVTVAAPKTPAPPPV